MSETNTKQSFKALNLPPNILSKLDRLGFVTPTPIQRESIPLALLGRDLIGIAQTGTGKTLAFGLPIMANLQQGAAALVLAPTRELAQQIEETFNKLNIKTALVIGGAGMNKQVSQLRSKPAVIIATPGRLIDHLNQRTVDLRNVSVVVLDEADRMLDMGFAPAIRRILDRTPKERQTMLFSATMPREILDLAQHYLHKPERVEIEKAGTTVDAIEQHLRVVQHEDKPAHLEELLKEHKGTVLVFARTRHGARKLARTVRNLGHSAAELHSDRTLAQRKAALHGFKTGTYRVLVATDIAARGIDVKDIALVVNYDVPENPEDYVHRIGRTGRAGATGLAITLATPGQHRDVCDIERLIRKELTRSSGEFISATPRQQPIQHQPRTRVNRGRLFGKDTRRGR